MFLIALSLLFSFSPVTCYQSDYELSKQTNHRKEGILQEMTLAYVTATSEHFSGSEQLSKDFLSPSFTRRLRSNTIKANRIKNQEALNSSKLEYEVIIQNTLNPVAAPGASPTSYSFPSGPYITALLGNERIVIPDPPLPSMLSDPEQARSHCPHFDDDLHYWDDINTWGGIFPVADENITLPANTRVLIRESVPGILGFITVPQTSELIFGENDSGISLETKGISVIGNLTIGSETCRIRTPITITLHGYRPVDAVKNIRPPEYKGVSVTGRISMHGKRFYRTWTRLAQTVNIGQSVIMLQHEVNWTPGQTIVLITTAMKDSREWHRNELAVVKKVIPNPVFGVGAAVILEEPVVYQHLAIRGYQGEVGLLTRTIKIQGNFESEPIDRDPLNCVQSQSINGDAAVPCPNTELTGFGGHIIIHSGGKGYVEGTELYRMGQTNVMGRYPMHFHLLGRSCQDCYFRDSSIHRSYYRCVSIHATDLTQISENVAYDVMGFCYYLEEGVEEENRLEFNLGALIHLIGPGPPTGGGQALQTYQKSDNLTLPADVAASAFYITNVKNYIVGNAASGGWAGYAFPSLPTPLGLNRDKNFRPSSVRELLIDGNSAHSTGWWWKSASAFYFGGSLYYNDSGVLEYQPGRDLVHKRSTCIVDKCLSGNCGAYCKQNEMAWISMSNSKAYLVANIGLSSWGGRLELHGFECHDCGMAMAALASDGFFAKSVLAECRSQVPIVMPNTVRANKLRGDGFRWYDTGQEHILSDITFRNCGYRSNDYDHYDKGSTRGCGDESDIGCLPDASVWTFITHSDEHVPEIMQATRGVRFENCGRRFFFYDFRQGLAWHPSSVSGRCQNWLDIDGSVTGFNERSVAASGLSDAGMWWQVDQEGKSPN
jgi:G8 domain